MLSEKILEWLETTSLRKNSGANFIKGAELALGTSLGLLRKENEDRMIFFKSHSPSNGNISGVLLCDGMGGLEQGGKCASFTISTFIEKFINNKLLDCSRNIEKSLIETNELVYKKFKGKSGSTIVGYIVTSKKETICFSVGDSRIYQLGKNQFKQITSDDTIDGQLSGMKSQIDPSILRSNQLLQYIGMDSDPKIHKIEFSNEILDTKRFMLTSDGAHSVGNLMLETLARTTTENPELVKRIILLADWMGGHDNSSVIILNHLDFFNQNLKNSYPDLKQQLIEVWNISGSNEFWHDEPELIYKHHKSDFGSAIQSDDEKKLKKEKNKKISPKQSKKLDQGQESLLIQSEIEDIEHDNLDKSDLKITQ